MSNFIDQLLRDSKPSPTEQNHLLTRKLYESKYMIDKNQQITIINEDKLVIKKCLAQKTTCKNIDYEAIINIPQKVVKINCLVKKNNLIEFIGSDSLRKIVISYTSKFIHKFIYWQPLYLININTGQIKLRYPHYNMTGLIQDAEIFFKYIENIQKNLMYTFKTQLAKILQLSNRLCENQFRKNHYLSRYISPFLQKSDLILSPIVKHMGMVHCNLTISRHLQSDFDCKNQEQLEQLNYHICEASFLDISTLFMYNPQKQFQKNTKKQYYITMQDSNIFKPIVAMPQPKIDYQSKVENKFIFNYVRINNPNNIQVQPFKNGGFSHLKLTKVMLQYIQSIDSNFDVFKEDEEFKRAPSLTKWVVIKLPKRREDQRSLDRQIKIVKILKSAGSGYLFKYYISNQENFLYKNRLMLDASSDPNLHEYLSYHKTTLSLKRKLSFLSQIAQAIRFLKDYGIVHMDLKPSNIMLIVKEFIIKVVDFGQAYHQQISNHQYSPGFTLPYAPPQGFRQDHKQFTFRQDIFSFGMMAFQIIFNRHLIENTSCKIKILYQQKKYLQKIFMAPQISSQYGDKKIISILLRLILKCIEPQQMKRPVPIWLVIIIRQIVNYFYYAC